jgi:hypothetical protein
MRAGNCAMTRRRSALDIEDHLAISASERPQPQHRPVSRSMSQILTQGVSIPVGLAALLTPRM